MQAPMDVNQSPGESTARMSNMMENADSPNWLSKTQTVADAVRRRVLEHTLKNNGGYMSQACSSAEILSALYLNIMHLGPSQAPRIPKPFAGVPSATNNASFTGADYNGPQSANLDRFVFSPVHYALVLYALLIELKRLDARALEQFNQDGSTMELIGAEHSPGHEVTAGSLSQAISQAAGIAYARKLRGDTGRVWVFMTDGEFQEGQTWEALASIAFHKIDNLGVFLDANGQQCDGKMDGVMNIEPLKDRLISFGADVEEVDGHDIRALVMGAKRRQPDKALVVICRTDPCHGLELLRSRAPRLHYLRFTNDQERRGYEQALVNMQSSATGAE